MHIERKYDLNVMFSDCVTTWIRNSPNIALPMRIYMVMCRPKPESVGLTRLERENAAMAAAMADPKLTLDPNQLVRPSDLRTAMNGP